MSNNTNLNSTCDWPSCGPDALRVHERLDSITQAEFDLACEQAWFLAFITPDLGVVLVDRSTDQVVAGWCPIKIDWMAHEVLNGPAEAQLVLSDTHAVAGDELCVLAMILHEVADLQLAHRDQEDPPEGLAE